MHSSAFRLMAFGLFLATSHTHAGIEDLTILTSPDGKQFVILAGDIHDRQPGTQTERLAQAIATLQKQDPTPFLVGIEMPAKLFFRTNRITTDIEPALKSLNIPNLTVKDCEIRNLAGLALWLLSMKQPELTCPATVFEVGGKRCVAGEATLADLETEFEEIHSPLCEFALTLPDLEKDKFQLELLYARNQLKKFQQDIKPFIHESKTILKTAISVARYNKVHPTEYTQENVQNMVCLPFSTLLNLTIIRDILRPRSNKQLFLAGALHTRAIREFLLEAQWKTDSNRHAEQSSQDPEAISFSPLAYIKTTTEE